MTKIQKYCPVMTECKICITYIKIMHFSELLTSFVSHCNVALYPQDYDVLYLKLHFLLNCGSWSTANANPNGSICTLSDPRRERSRHWLADACRAQVNKTSGNNSAVYPCFSMTFQRKPLIFHPDVHVKHSQSHIIV